MRTASFPRRRTARIQLSEEYSAALGLVDFSDLLGLACETQKTSQEADVRRGRPTHVSGTSPAVLPERIESTVVPDAKVGVSLQRSAAVPTDHRPSDERPGMRCDKFRQFSMRIVRGCRALDLRGELTVLDGKNRRRQATRRHVHCVRIGHLPTVI